MTAIPDNRTRLLWLMPTGPPRNSHHNPNADGDGLLGGIPSPP